MRELFAVGLCASVLSRGTVCADRPQSAGYHPQHPVPSRCTDQSLVLDEEGSIRTARRVSRNFGQGDFIAAESWTINFCSTMGSGDSSGVAPVQADDTGVSRRDSMGGVCRENRPHAGSTTD